MLFNSVVFIFVFLPFVLLIYYGVAQSPLRAPVPTGPDPATLVFYGLGNQEFVPLLIASVAFNYIAGLVVERCGERPETKNLVLFAAVIINLMLLGYFKYFSFVVSSLESVLHSGFAIERIAAPLGISFFTFQQIGFLFDVSRGRVSAGKPLDYASFLLFFPQLLAGPIVQYKETVPQLREAVKYGTVCRSILVGLVYFSIGLFKKTVVADTAALYASPVFDAARTTAPIGLLESWIAAFSYTSQVYFDFSGYSDMAIGTARMFGIILPLNFHSPLRSASVVEIWRRWHITLGRWVQSYVFQPISISTGPASLRHAGSIGPALFIFAVLIPTMISMLIVGIWHEAAGLYLRGLRADAGLLHGDQRGMGCGAQEGSQGAQSRLWRTAALEQAGVAGGNSDRLRGIDRAISGSADLGTTGRMWFAMLGMGPRHAEMAGWPLGTIAAVLCTILGLRLCVRGTEHAADHGTI